MKKIILMMSVIALFTGASCKTKEKASNDSSSTATNTKGMQSEKKFRFVVSFFSIGTGLDSEAFGKFEKFVNSHPNKPAYVSYHWGREGEVDLAFNLKEIKKTADQTKFIADLKKAIGDSDRVRFKENEFATGKIIKKAE